MPKPDDALQVCLDAELIGREAMYPYAAMWQKAYRAYNTGGVKRTSRKIQVCQNHVLPIVETVLPRDATALHPQRPYFPVGAVNDEQDWRAELTTQAVDAVVSRGKYFPSFVLCTKKSELYGDAFIEPQRHYWIENILEQKPVIAPDGSITDYDEEPTGILQDGLRFPVHSPWNVLLPPGGYDLDTKEFDMIREYVNISEVEKLLDSGPPWKLAKGVTMESLRNGPSGAQMDEWSTQFRKDMSVFTGRAAERTVVLLRYHSEDRWIVVVNYAAVIMDTENQHVNLPRFKKPLAHMRMNPRIGDDTFYGTGWHERTADLADISDLLTSTEFHERLMQAAKWVIVDPDMMDPDQVRRARYGDVLELSRTGDASQALSTVDLGPPRQGFGDLQQFIEGAKNARTGINDIVQGQAPTPKQTGGATQLLSEAANTRIAFGARYFEATYLPEMADLVTAEASRMTKVQLADIVGWENAEALKTVDPRNIPGGFEYEFDGSDRMSRRAQKFEQLNQVWNYLSQAPIIQQNPEAQRALMKIYLSYVEAIKKKDIPSIIGMPGQQMLGAAPMGGMEAAPAMTPPQEMPTPASNQDMGVPV